MPEVLHEKIDYEQMNLLYIISDGSKSDMDAWKRADIFEFYTGLWVFQDKIKNKHG